MSYSISQERAAQDRLAQIWKASSRRERLSLATRFGYGGSDASKLRSMRRLLTGTLGKGQTALVTDYFKPFVTNLDDEAWTGRTPSYTLTSLHTIQSQVMYVTQNEYGFSSWEAKLNLSWKGLGYKEKTQVSSMSITDLFSKYSKVVKHSLGKYRGRDDFNERGEDVVGIAFSQKGAEQLKKYIEDLGYVVGSKFIPKPFIPYGIGLVPTSSVFKKEGKKKVRQQHQTKTYQRSFPKSKRDDMIRYANRSYGQMKRKGGRLA